MSTEPKPPINLSRDTGHHWLQIVDFDNRAGEYVVMQWQPNAQKWCHSGYCASGRNVDTTGWLYVCQVKHPLER